MVKSEGDPRKGGSHNVRAIALDILNRVDEKGAYANISLDSYLKRADNLKKEDRGLITELVNGTLRWRKRIDWIIQRFSRQNIKRLPPQIINILRIGVYQLLFLNRIPPRAAVHEAVKLARSSTYPSLSGYVNAVLRSIDRERMQIPLPDPSLDKIKYISVFHSFPEWMIERWIAKWGYDMTVKLCESLNRVPPLTLRTNTLCISRDDLIFSLERFASVRKTSFSPVGIIIKGLQKLITELEEYRKGFFQVQDEASQLITLWLSPRPGERILDACAAPGGKTTHIAQMMENRGKIWAVDIHKSRLNLVKDACYRLGVSIVDTVVADLTMAESICDEVLFDRILLDSPCSGLGILHRHPDARWRRNPEDISRMADLQKVLLEKVSRHLKIGGTLVYSVCTFTEEENEEVIDDFLRRNNSFRLSMERDSLPETCSHFIDKEGFLRIFPWEDQMDGFFAAKMTRIG